MMLRSGTPNEPRSSRIYAGNQQRQPAKVPFVYVGNGSLSVTGPISGIRYTFTHPGAKVQVDARDLAMIASIRHLRQVK